MNLDDLSLREAADLCNVSVATVRRRKAQLQAFGAVCDSSGWHVSLEQLIAVGLTTKVRAQPDEGVTDTSSNDALVQALKAHIATLEDQLARERIRADQAEMRLDRLLPASSSADTQENPQKETSEEDHKEADAVKSESPKPKSIFSKIKRFLS